MSNDLVLQAQNVLAQLRDIASDGLDEDTLAVAGNANSKRISIKGGVFRKIVGGKEIGKIEDRHMNIIFVKMAHTPSRTYYPAAYVEGAKLAPTCWSSDAKVPDAAVKSPQGVSCDKCPHSVKGTGQNGQGTACRIAWRTAVVLPTDPEGDVMQLTLPAASVFGDENSGRYPFRAYIQLLANHNVSAGRVVTRMQFDTDAPSPRVLFSPVGVVPPEHVAVVKQQATTPAAENAVTMTVYHRDEESEAPAPASEVANVLAAAKQAEDDTPAAEPPSVAEPVLRQPPSAAPVPEKNVSDVIAKWSKK